jgi:hypothetical protein
MNADDLFEKTREYFLKRLGQPLLRASFKAARDLSSYEAEKAYEALRRADYIFVGPGSPTYALRNWAGTPIPRVLEERIREGACFVSASAAALTLGPFTLPVYEVYKAGEEVHWVEGLNLLGRLGVSMVVIPHWNNAEGGTHDTRFCYMGEPRLLRLEKMLPPGTPILGVDEHTSCILDFSSGRVGIRGVGGVTLRLGGEQKVFGDGETMSLEDFRQMLLYSLPEKPAGTAKVQTIDPGAEPFMGKVKSMEEAFGGHLRDLRAEALIRVLVDLDKLIWISYREFEDEEKISEAREIFRGMIVRLGVRLDGLPRDIPSLLAPLVDVLLEVRRRLRSAKQWELADLIRDGLDRAGIIVEDTEQGPKWHMQEKG